MKERLTFCKKYNFLKEYEEFFKRIQSYIKEFDIKWIGFKKDFEFKKKFIEIYFE